MVAAPFFILEGPDCTGKSTLAKTLQQYTGAKIIHLQNRFRGRMWAYHNWAMRQAIDCLSRGQAVILDRFWPSEHVYGVTLRKKEEYPGRLLDRIVRRWGGVYIACTSEWESYIDRYKRHIDPAHPYDEKQIRAVWDGYQSLWGRWFQGRTDIVVYDIDEFDHHQLRAAQYAYECWKIRRIGGIDQLPWWAGVCAEDVRNATMNWTGWLPEAKVLLLGDQLNARKTSRREVWPFHDNQDSSKHLATQLNIGMIKESDLCMANVNHRDFQDQVSVIRNSNIPVICMGLEARAAASMWKLNVQGSVSHPSFAKRFSQKEWGKDLCSTIRRVTDAR